MSMNRRFSCLSLAGVAAVALSSIAGSALALPALMDRIPSSSFLTIVVPNPQKLEQSLKSTATAMGVEGDQINLEAVLQMIGVADSVNAQGALAVMVPLPAADKAKGAKEDRGIVLVPVKDYTTFAKGLGGVGSAQSEKVQMPDGDEMFIKNISDGYAAMSKHEADLFAFKADKGQMGAHRKLISAHADKVADASDVVILVNVEMGRAVIKEGLEKGRAEMLQNMAMMGPQAPDLTIPNWLVDAFVDQGRSVLLGLKLDGNGVSADAVGTFTEGSPLAKATVAGGKAGALLRKLPKRDFLVSGALDMSSEGWRDFIKGMPQPKDAAGGANKMMDMGEALKNTQGASFLLGFNPGGLMAGILTQTITYTASGPEGVKSFQSNLTKMQELGLGTTKYTPAKVDVNGTKVDEYEMKMKADPNNPQMGQAMIFMFGPSGGPSGYVAAVDGGYVQTMSRSSDLMGAALKAAKGENTLDGDAQIKAVADRMPAGRFAELYIGPKAIVDTVKPMIAMFMGAAVDYEVPATTQPLGLALASSEGSLHANIYVPNQTVKVMSEFVKGLEKARQGEDPADAAPAPAPKKDKGEKPKF